jgi:hypothetical protein
MKMRIVLISCVFMLLELAAFAQNEFPKFEVAVDYSYARFNPSHIYIKNSYSLDGGGGSFDFNFNKYLGLKVEFEGYGSNTQNFIAPAGTSFCPLGCTANIQGNLFTYQAGPQVGRRTGRFRPFGELLFGGAHSNVYGNISKIPGITTGSTAPSLNAFAMTVGGGLDITLNKSGSIALRPAEVDYLYTRFNSSSINATGQSAQSNFRYQAGVVFNFGGGAPPLTPAASCSAQPSEVMVGEPVTVTASPSGFDPKHTLTYSWNSNGGKISGTGSTGSIDTNGVAGGSYTATATITDSKLKKNNTASCSANFTVKEPPKNPPTMSCSASPASLQAGGSSTITCSCTSPDNVQVTVGSWTATSGSVSGSGNTGTLNTTGASPGAITVTAACTDSRGLSTPASTQVTVENLPPPPPQASKLTDCDFANMAKIKKPWRVDNECKGKLDDVAKNLQQNADSKLVIVGNADPSEQRPNLAAERAVNSKAYLTSGEAQLGIDPNRIECRTGSAGTMTAEYWIVPAGATFSEEGTQPVDESQVKAVPDHPARKKATAKQ